MAITLTVEDGTVVTGANSYVTLAEANLYMGANTHAFEEWDALDDDVKVSLLVWATRYLDQRAIWNGGPVSVAPATQALRWPRTGAYDRDQIVVPDDVIPVQLKEATIEMARFLIGDERSKERDQDGLTRLRVDVIDLHFNTSYRLPQVPTQIVLMLQGIGTISSSGSNFAPIRKA